MINLPPDKDLGGAGGHHPCVLSVSDFRRKEVNRRSSKCHTTI